jgi:hypothetical protein
VTSNGEGTVAASVKRAFVAKTGHRSQLIALALLRREAVRYRAADARFAEEPPSGASGPTGGYEPNVQLAAQTMKGLPGTHVVIPNSPFGAASMFTMCYLQEMVWPQTATLNAEGFQGPFETIDLARMTPDRRAKRVIRFLQTYAKPIACADGTHFHCEVSISPAWLCSSVGIRSPCGASRRPFFGCPRLRARRSPVHVEA